MNVCAKCGFENNANVKNCTNCVTDLHWAKVNLGKFDGNTDDTRRIGIESRKARGIPVPEDESKPLEPIHLLDTNPTNDFWLGVGLMSVFFPLGVIFTTQILSPILILIPFGVIILIMIFLAFKRSQLAFGMLVGILSGSILLIWFYIIFIAGNM